jgi:hypothetical protein
MENGYAANQAAPSKTPPQGGSNQLDSDGDVVMATADESTSAKASSEPAEPKYGLQVMCRAVESMIDAIAGPDAELKALADLLLSSEFSLDLAVNTFLNEDRVVSDFRRVIGYDWDPQQPTKVMGGQPPYNASIPAGPLGLTVENILEVRCFEVLLLPRMISDADNLMRIYATAHDCRRYQGWRGC